MKIYISPFHYTLRAMTREELDDGETWGFHDCTIQVIAIDPRASPERQARTLIHELIHACYAHVGNRVRKMDEEAVCTMLDGALTMIFKDNPELLPKLSMALNNGVRLVGAGQIIGAVPAPAVPIIAEPHLELLQPFVPYAAAVPAPKGLDDWMTRI